MTETVNAYLAAADAEVPGVIEGLYLEGSAALDDFQPHTSDIDFVAVTATRLNAHECAKLARVHSLLDKQRHKPYFDGVYLTWTDLTRGPSGAGPVPHAHEGRFHAASHGEHSPVTWHTLAKHGIACRGPQPADLDIWADPAALATWTDGNLDTYWRRWVDRAIPLVSKHGLYALTGYATVWLATGVSRLHYTLATGEITSKTGAARYALDTFPNRWHRLLNESLRIRTGRSERSLYRHPWGRRRDALAFGDMVIADAHRIHNG